MTDVKLAPSVKMSSLTGSICSSGGSIAGGGGDGLRKKYHLILKNDMPPRDNKFITGWTTLTLLGKNTLASKKKKLIGVYNLETAMYGKIWCDEDVHDLISVETKFPAIVFNDELTSERALSCKPMVSSLNNNEIDFRISFDEFDDEDYTNRMVKIYNLCTDLTDFADMDLPHRDQRPQYLRFEGLRYTDADIIDFEKRLGKIYRREGQGVFIRRTWRRLFEIRGPLVYELILEFFSIFREFILGMGMHTAEEIKSVGFGAYWAKSARQIPDKRDMSAYWVGISYVLGDARRSMTWRQFILALGLRGLSVVTHEIPLIDMGELVKLNICREIRDDWAWVASGLERQHVAAAGTPEASKDAPVVDEGAQAYPAPI
nr:hypothetical protein [Tanacetum cinerariifolium]